MITAPASLDAAVDNRRRLQKLLTFNRTDAGNAEAFAYLHGDRFRFDHSREKWLVWNGRYWAKDETGEADRAAVDTARQILLAATRIEDEEARKKAVGWAFHSESAHGRRAMLSSAQTQASLATIATDYDRDQFLFNVGNGTLDLRTGKLRACDPNDLITKATHVPYDPRAVCPRWDLFLKEIFAGDTQLISFVQRAVGYSLSGDVREQCLFILQGGGANGKSTFLELILKLAGGYGAITSFSTFLIQHNPGTPRNDVARLHGARLVKAAESQKQAALDEATVKEVTGGDTIAARFLFKEFFEYRPQFKIWLATNHRPLIQGTDNAIWRRLRLIPFTQQFTGRQRDPKLREKLEAELPGILAWAVLGCLEWQRIGLGTSSVVEKATLSYRRESDHFGRFLNERCTNRTTDQTTGKELFDAYVEWCERAGEKPEANNSFAKALADRGLKKKRTSKGVVYAGVGLRPQAKSTTLAADRTSGQRGV
jgi:putative DNA primase/helicase